LLITSTANTLLPWQLLIPPQTWHTRDVLNYISQNAERNDQRASY